MSDDKIRAAERKRMTETGEPYAAARRAVVSEHQAAGGRGPLPGAGYALRMSGEIHDWLADLHRSDPPSAARVRRALAALMKEGAGLGDPLVASTTESWPWALSEALDQSYQQNLGRLQALRKGEADAVALSRDIEDQIANWSPRGRIWRRCTAVRWMPAGRRRPLGQRVSGLRSSGRQPRCNGCCRG